MDLLILVTHPDAGAIVKPLVQACVRAGIEWGVFFTHDGVRLLQDPEICGSLEQAHSAVACLDSWSRCMRDDPCPVEVGSQTDSSALAGRAGRVISL